VKHRAALFTLFFFIPFLSACVTTSGVTRGESASHPSVGVDVGEASSFRSLVSAKELESAAAKEYNSIIQKAQKELVTNTAQGQRVVGIAKRIIAFAPLFNEDAKDWEWEVNLIKSDAINAFCMPGGKIAFYTGLTEGLKLTDDEIAIVMGHEAAHALREHARAQIGKSRVTSVGASLLGIFVGGGQYDRVFGFGANLLTLKFSRDDESEADLVGIDLAARAGFDPRAGITLWQKMAAAGGGSPIPWFSTHPGSANRIQEIEAALPKVMPLYEEASKK